MTVKYFSFSGAYDTITYCPKCGAPVYGPSEIFIGTLKCIYSCYCEHDIVGNCTKCGAPIYGPSKISAQYIYSCYCEREMV